MLNQIRQYNIDEFDSTSFIVPKRMRLDHIIMHFGKDFNKKDLHINVKSSNNTVVFGITVTPTNSIWSKDNKTVIIILNDDVFFEPDDNYMITTYHNITSLGVMDVFGKIKFIV